MSRILTQEGYPEIENMLTVRKSGSPESLELDFLTPTSDVVFRERGAKNLPGLDVGLVNRIIVY